LNGGGGGDPFYSGDFGGGISDIFESFFGGGGMQRPDQRGADLRYDIELTLEEAFSGIERTIHYPHMTVCGTCRGVGSESGSPVPCPACAGTGQRRQVSNNFFGMQFSTIIPCDRCGATGEIISNPCKTCHGEGRVRAAEELTVRIPPGVDTGSRIRHRGKGDMGLRGAQPGDLIIAVSVREHSFYKRRASDLFCEVALPFTIAALGGKLAVETLSGSTEVEVPAGTQTGQTFRLRGRGMPNLDSGHLGDQYVIVSVAVPTDLSARQRELLRELAQERGEEVNAHKGLFQKVKDAVDDLRGGAKEPTG
jgi:molecular chaperone DnaJ